MNTSTQYGLGGLLIGLILGIVVAPSLSPRMGMMGGSSWGRGASSQNIDRHFIDQMIPHHEGAIAMAKLALERSKRPEIISLSNGIIEAQTKEINDMTTWYQEWFNASPSTNSSYMGHGMHMGGMQTVEGDLTALKNSTDFDKEFLRQMIVHHEMAVMMAQMLDASTERSEMKELADNIITSQNREIQMMKSWLAAW